MPDALPDKFSLYELAAQHPARDAALLLAIYRSLGGKRSPATRSKPLTLGEDFCGTAALSRAWCELDPSFTAHAVDIDAPTVARAKRTPHDRVALQRVDVLKAKAKVDLIAVQNFSICELNARETLVRYLAHARSRLKPGGAFVCDLYGGSDAYATGSIPQTIAFPPSMLGAAVPKGTKLVYTWEQRAADPLKGRVENAMHFAVRFPKSSGRKLVEMPDAFVYRWRLWSPPELADAMTEAGFSRVLAYPRTPDALDEHGRPYVLPIDSAEDVADAFNIYVCGAR